MVDPAHYADIQRHVAAGDFAGAEAICVRLADHEGANPAFWQVRGDIALMAENWIDAEAHYRWTATLFPDGALAWLGLARAYSSSNRHVNAGTAAQRALALGLNGDHAIAAREIVAQAAFARGDVVEGRAELAALLPVYRAKLAEAPKDPTDILSRALPTALCARDEALVEHIMRATYPHAGPLSQMTVVPTATLENWCRDAGVPCEVLDPPRAITLEPTSPYGRRFAYTTDPILFAHIPHGEWMPGWDFALAPDGTVLENSGYFEIRQIFNHMPHAHFPAAQLVAHRSSHQLEYVDEDVLWVSAPGHGHVGHWLIDFIPRLAGRAHAGHPVKIAIPDTLTGAKYRETLALAGVQDSDIIRCRPEVRYRFRTLHIYRPGRSMPPHPQNVRYLRSVLYGDASPVRGGKGKRIFLSRAKIGTRQAINAAAFDEFLRAHDFVSVNMADLTIAQQREFFADAEVLLGAVGSDLLAMYFAPPGCTVISMQCDADSDRCAPPTAVILGMKHQFLLCATSRPSPNARNELDRDFVVDCAELSRRLREA